jgi:hypothetical protein
VFSSFEGTVIEVEARSLGDVDSDGADTGADGLGLVAVGVAAAVLGSLVRAAPEGLGTFEFQGFIEENGDGLDHAVIRSIDRARRQANQRAIVTARGFPEKV